MGSCRRETKEMCAERILFVHVGMLPREIAQGCRCEQRHRNVFLKESVAALIPLQVQRHLERDLAAIQLGFEDLPILMHLLGFGGLGGG